MFEYVSECKGVDWQEEIQLNFLDRVVPKYFPECVPQENAGLTLVDTYLLYTMIRERKPEVMIEIGAGDSTHISLQALEKNRVGGEGSMFYSVDPYPADDVRVIQREGFELKRVVPWRCRGNYFLPSTMRLLQKTIPIDPYESIVS